MTTLARRGAFAAALLLALALVLASPAADAYVIGGHRWPGQTIRYYPMTPGYAGAIDRAAAAWNRAHVGVTFVRASASRYARIRVSVSGGGCEGNAQLGYSRGYRHATVDMGTGCGGRGLLELMLVHELGHLLGLDHETHRCARMNPVMHHDGTPIDCARHKMSWWLRHPLTADDIRGARALYLRRG